MLKLTADLNKSCILRKVEVDDMDVGGRYTLAFMLFLYRICRTEDGVYMPMENAWGTVYFFHPNVSLDDEFLRYREMKKEDGSWKSMRSALCRALNLGGFERCVSLLVESLEKAAGVSRMEEGEDEGLE